MAGLSAALELRRGGADPVVFEAEARPGGKVGTRAPKRTRNCARSPASGVPAGSARVSVMVLLAYSGRSSGCTNESVPSYARPSPQASNGCESGIDQCASSAVSSRWTEIRTFCTAAGRDPAGRDLTP